MKITEFIKEKTKRAGIKNIKELANYCNVPLTTFYRYVQGETTISPNVVKILSDMLKLDETEIDEFHELIENAIPNKSMKKSFQMIDMKLFGNSFPHSDLVMSSEIEFLYREKYLMTVEAFFKRMLVNADAQNFCCCLRIVHGIGEGYFQQLTDFIEELYARIPDATVEHLISLSQNDYINSVKALIDVFPLLKYEKYSLFYTEKDSIDYTKKILGHSF